MEKSVLRAREQTREAMSAAMRQSIDNYTLDKQPQPQSLGMIWCGGVPSHVPQIR